VPLVEAPEGGDGVGAEGLGALKIGVGVVGWVVRGDRDVGVEADDFDEGVVGVGEVGGVPGYWMNGVLRLVDGWGWGWIPGRGWHRAYRRVLPRDKRCRAAWGDRTA
jgi:hypothetical protein